MQGVLFTKPAILVHLDSVKIVLLVLHCVVISLFAFLTSQRNLTRIFTPPKTYAAKAHNLKSGTLLPLPYFIIALSLCQQNFSFFMGFSGTFFIKGNQPPCRPFLPGRQGIGHLCFVNPT